MVDLFLSASTAELVKRGLVIVCENEEELRKVKLRRMHRAIAVYVRISPTHVKVIKDRNRVRYEVIEYATTIL